VAPGIDILADRGSVTLYGPAYHTNNEVDFADLPLPPDWLVAEMKKACRSLRERERDGDLPRHITPMSMAQCQRKLDEAIVRIQNASQGEKWDTLRRQAYLIGGIWTWTNWTSEELWEEHFRPALELSEQRVGGRVRDWRGARKTFLKSLEKGSEETIGNDPGYLNPPPSCSRQKLPCPSASFPASHT
jgi:hypothetical protein